MTIVDALQDRALFGRLPIFRDLGSWTRWLVFLRALFALPMDDQDRALCAQHTGRQAPPAAAAAEAYVCAGRRSGKT